MGGNQIFGLDLNGFGKIIILGIVNFNIKDIDAKKCLDFGVCAPYSLMTYLYSHKIKFIF